MSENNFESLNEQEIAELYGDVLEDPTLVAGAIDMRDGCGIGRYCKGYVTSETTTGFLGIRRTDYTCHGSCGGKIADWFEETF